jgi:site-specific recombinase XerD
VHTIELDLADFKATWMLADKAESTIDDYLSRLRKYQSWIGEKTPSMQTARAFLAESKQNSPSAAYMNCRALKAFGRWWAEEYNEPDPYERLKYLPQPKPTKQVTATVEDVETLLASIPEESILDYRDRAIIHTLASTGMRRAELSRMLWTDLDLAAGVIYLPKTKNGHPRTARLSQEARRAIKRYQRALDWWEDAQQRLECEWVWPSLTCRTGPIKPNGITQMIQRRSRDAGVTVTAHSFRRGFAVKWLRSGGSEVYLREIAGWRSPRMVERYVSALKQEEALDEHERIFG